MYGHETEEHGGGELKGSSKNEVGLVAWRRRLSAGGQDEGLGENCAEQRESHLPNPNQTSVSLRRPLVNFPCLVNGVDFSGR